ncbi:hypothetical protein L6452_41131 [Arctium lappa]|uniref:Uncharacterized protein n=1 Tax=Arctium lappa TaxID=4217 RepID=A0ACB8XNG7_ARCLA|nr:hypothetical protein L6452_41131 [Arctium lappa]
MSVVHKSNPYSPLRHRDFRRNTAECGGGAFRGLGVGKIGTKLVMNCRVNDGYCRRRYGDHCCTDNGGDNGGRKKGGFVEMMREGWPYFEAYRGRIFVVVICAEVIESSNLGAILQDISLLQGLGIKLVLVPGIHVQIDKLLADKGCEPKYVGRYRITDPDSLKAAMDLAGRICLMIQAKLSPGPSLYNTRRHGDNTQLHHTVSVATGNFLAAKKRGVVEGIDYEATGEVKKIDVSRIRERLDNDSIVILSNLGHSSSGDVLNCNTYEVATACALALEAEKLICIIDGPILDESERVIRFLSIEDADELIRKHAQQSEIAANYVKAIGDKYGATFQNGVGFDNGNGFAIGDQERLSRSNGYLSELAAAAFVCRGGVQRVHLLDGNIGGVLLKELFQRDGTGTMVASDLYEGTRMAKAADFPAIRRILKAQEDSGALVRWTNEEVCISYPFCALIHSEESILHGTANAFLGDNPHSRLVHEAWLLGVLNRVHTRGKKKKDRYFA